MSRPEIVRARSVCDDCPVRATCLGDALQADDGWGVWGGYTNPERIRAMAALGTITAVLTALEGGVVPIEAPVPTAVVFEPKGLDRLVRLT